jgi:hypothetical protein
LEELYKYGEWMRAIPKDEKKTEQSEPINIDVNKVSETMQDK